MNYDLMSVDPFYWLMICLLWTSQLISAEQTTTIYVQRGGTIELCDNRTTMIYAYEYRSLDGQRNHIVEPNKISRYSNPYGTSVLRIRNAIDNDSGYYKCPQDDTEWQRLQVFTPVQHVYLSNLDSSLRVHGRSMCENEDECLSLVEGEPLNVVCATDGNPRPSVDLIFDKKGSKPTIMALAGEIQIPQLINNRFRPTVYESYRIVGLTSEDNGRNVTCQVDMKHIDKNLVLSTSKQLYVEFRPIVNEKSKKVYCGINQTRTINCTVLRANPRYIRYSIQNLSPTMHRQIIADGNEFFYTFEITPSSLDHFRPFNVTANNSIGFDTCSYELIHGGVPDPITECTVDSHNANITRTITISCTKSYAQGDNEGYACTLFKFNEKPHRRMFEETARTKSCIFALEYSNEPVEYRVAAFNRFGSLPVNKYGYVIHLNQPTAEREAAPIHRRFFFIILCIFGGIVFFCLLYCICSNLGERDRYPTKSDFRRKNHNERSMSESDDLKSSNDEATLHLASNGNDKNSHQNGFVYDTPSEGLNKYLNPMSSSTPTDFNYHQQKVQPSMNNYFPDQDPLISNPNLRNSRIHTVNNKFYGQPLIDPRYDSFPLSKQGNIQSDEGDDSPVYSTTTDALSENGSFLVSSFPNRHIPPAPKPRYSTLAPRRSSIENPDKTPYARPRSRSNSRNRLNHSHTDNAGYLYEERPGSSSDSGIGQSDGTFLSNPDKKHTTMANPDINSSQKAQTVPVVPPHPVKFQSLTSNVLNGTEC